MAPNPDSTITGRGSEIIYYPGPQVVVTSRRIGDYPVGELTKIWCEHEYAYPARVVAMICGGIELALAAPLALAFGAVLFLVAGVIAALSVAGAILLDGRRNPRWMAIRAEHRGRVVTLFSSRHRQEFGHVKRAVIRAVEANRRWR